MALESLSIIDMLIESVNANLLYQLQTIVDSHDPTRAYQVKIGLLQDDPTNGANIMTHANDPDNPNDWLHTVVSGPGATDLHTHLSNYPYEIGGGEMWFRRFTTQLEIFCTPNSTRDTARHEANRVLRRAENAIRTANVGVGPDEWGECGLAAYVVNSVNTEGGGASQFIYNAYIKFQVLTGQSRR